MSPKSKIVLGLIFLAVIDLAIPVPILALLLLFVVAQKPRWFRTMVDDIYR